MDHQLSFSANVRAILDENYERASTKPIKSASNTNGRREPDHSEIAKNPLLIRPLGIDRDMKTWWQIDGMS